MREISFSKDNEKTLLFLRKINKLKGLSDAELINFAEYGKLSEYEAGELIIKEGSSDCWVYFLVNGSLQVYKGQRQISTLHRCGDVFGEMGIIDGSPRCASVVAGSKVWLLSFDAAVIEEKLKTNQINFCYVIYRIFSEFLAVRLRNTIDENMKLRLEQEKLANELRALKGGLVKKKNGQSSKKDNVKAKRILIVDSVETTRKIIRSILKDLGFRSIYEAYDGIHALNILKEEESIDLVISEWDLAKLSGLELLETIRSEAKTKNKAFLMLLHSTDKKQIDLAYAAKANQCLMKPYTSNTFLEKIEEVFS